MKESCDNMQANKKGITIFCHFSFKRPKEKEYGLFAVAFYKDFEGKQLILAKTKKLGLWKNHQFITAIQAYENALATIYEHQGQMREGGVRQVMLVTDNSTIAGWIENPKKNKKYEDYMKKAVKQYRVGEVKEIVIGIGLCETREYEKSYKYCKEDRVCNNYEPKNNGGVSNNYKIRVPEGYKSAIDIVKDDINIPDTAGISEL